MKDILYGSEARELLQVGVNKLAKAVAVTMGPLGRNVLIQRDNENPFLTKDGVTVAGEVQLKNPVENMAASLVKEVSSNTAFEAGDGTTTSTVLTDAIFTHGVDGIKSSTNIVEMKKGMDSAVREVVSYIEMNSRKITSHEEIKQIATISANSDVPMGQMIADAMEAVGEDGIINIEENNGVTDELASTKGFKFNRGYMSPNFVTNPGKEIAEHENPFILVTDQRIGHLAHILPILQKVQETARPLIILADDFDPEALNTVVVNKVRGIMNMTVVKLPGFGDGKRDQMIDIAMTSGATIVGAETGRTFESLTLEDLGEAKRVVVEKQNTIIINGKGSSTEEITQHKNALKVQIEALPDGDAKVSLKSRLSRLSGAAAVIRVGAQTELEMREKKDRFDDAVAATKAAVAEGIVIGGGSALARASHFIKVNRQSTSSDFDKGFDVILEACFAPIEQIANNAGRNGIEIVGDLSEHENENFGWNALTDTYEDLFESGVIDPLKVTRIAIINACSCASTLLTTETVIYTED